MAGGALTSTLIVLMLSAVICFTLAASKTLFPGVLAEKEQSRPIVTTPLGKIEGRVGLSVNLNPFYKFEGVQFAKPPVGALRYENPQDPEPWIGIWKANTISRCMQYNHYAQDYQKNYIVHGDEDCLHVNIYTHSLSPTANMDVLVHFHGGAFMFGRGASYGPEIIMDRQLVFVNLNYRLGPLGFLSTEDDVLPGNLGLKDQVQALKWIKANIQYFGGNPDSITIHGLSAGGASVQLHYLIPASKGLFNQGISQSGCALNSWVFMENAKEKTEKVADLVGCPTGSSKEIKDCLKSKPAAHIAYAVKEFQPWLYNPFSPFGVVADGQWSRNPVLPDHPYNLLKNGKVQDLPWIISYTSAEGLYPAGGIATFSRKNTLLTLTQNGMTLCHSFYTTNDSVDPSLKDEISQKIRKHYLGDQPINRDTFATLVQIVTDRLFVADIETAARLHSAAVKSPVFSYSYNYRGTTSLSELMTLSEDNIGVSHGDDTMLILKIKLDFPRSELSSESDKKMSQLLVNLTTSFMKEGSPSKIIEKWTALSKNSSDSYRILKINNFDDLEMIEERREGEGEFWDSLPLKENEKLFTVKK